MRLENAIGKKFIHAIDECFPEGSKLRKIFNRNTIKISYSCMPNVKTIIEGCNKQKLAPQSETPAEPCNCRRKEECPLQGKCRAKEIVYQATVETTNDSQTYVGLTQTEFKKRLSNHKKDMKSRKYENSTELSKYIWSLKDQNKQYKVTWTILGRAKAYNNATKRCNLCLLEKFYILRRRGASTLNKRTELVSACRHAKKFLLQNVP